jgi:Cu-Zn family superoxide dismutase
MNTNTARVLLIAALGAYAPLSPAAPVTVTMHLIDSNGVGKSIGTVRAEDSKDGLVLSLKLNGLVPGKHGFHAHENAGCEPMEKDGKKTAGLAAGGHYDPDKSGKHEGPAGKGHLGDLPALVVDDKGMASERLVAPRLKVADLKGRSLMIHEGGDNYSDDPKPLGGGGARIACGVVK